jgi:hypothetical protein
MDILFGCHCDSYNQKMYYKEQGKPIQLIEVGKHNIASIEYISTDKRCKKAENQYIVWDDIPDHSKHLVYLIGCPIYNVFATSNFPHRDESKVWDDIRKLKRILKKNGKVVFVTDINNYEDPDGKLMLANPIEEQVRLIQERLPEWKVSFISIYDEIPVLITGGFSETELKKMFWILLDPKK